MKMPQNKISQITGILNRVKKFLPTRSLYTIYNSLVMSHIRYGLELWGGYSGKNKDRLKTIQKKGVRIICKSHLNSHTEPRMKNLKMLKFQDQHELQSTRLIYDLIHGYAPSHLSENLQLNRDAHNYRLRSANNNPDNLRTTAGSIKQVRFSFSNSAPKLWNKLPEDIKNSPNRNIFKNKLTNKFIDSYVVKTPCKNPNCKDKVFHV